MDFHCRKHLGAHLSVIPSHKRVLSKVYWSRNSDAGHEPGPPARRLASVSVFTMAGNEILVWWCRWWPSHGLPVFTRSQLFRFCWYYSHNDGRSNNIQGMQIEQCGPMAFPPPCAPVWFHRTEQHMCPCWHLHACYCVVLALIWWIFEHPPDLSYVVGFLLSVLTRYLFLPVQFLRPPFYVPSGFIRFTHLLFTSHYLKVKRQE